MTVHSPQCILSFIILQPQVSWASWEELTFCKRRLPYLGGVGRGKDENNQRKYALTQVYILCPGPLGKWQVFIKGFYDFFFHLADCVCIHDPDRQWVHATALEGHVDVLQKQTERYISHLSITGEFRIPVWWKLPGSQHNWMCNFGSDL